MPNDTVSAFLTEQRYLDLLRRHSQHVRWLVGNKCPCGSTVANINASCARCQGRGIFYTHQTTTRHNRENSAHSGAHIDTANGPILQVHSVKRRGCALDVVSFNGNNIEVALPANSPLTRLPRHYEDIEVDYTSSNVIERTVTSYTRYADNVFALDGLQFDFTREDNATLTRPYEIVEVVSVTDTANSQTFDVASFNRNHVILDGSSFPSRASITGTESGPFTITQQNNVFRLSGSNPHIVVTVSLETGSNLSASAVAADLQAKINSELTGFQVTAVNDSIVIETTATGSNTRISILDGQNTANSLLGFSVMVASGSDIGEVPQSNTYSFVVRLITPFDFVLSMVKERIDRQDGWTEGIGDAQLIVPYNYYTSVGDLITPLSGERRDEVILTYDENTTDYEINQFDVSSIVSITDSEGNSNFTESVDFIQIQNDKIRFLDGGTRPVGRFVVQYLYRPTYRIFKDTGTLRTSENKQFPRTSVLEIYKKTNVNYELQSSPQ